MVTNIYAYVAPSVIALLLLEMLYCKIKKKNYISFQDSIASYATAIMNQPMNLAVGMLVGITYGWIWNNTEHPVIEFGFWSQLTLYVAIDFLFYWFHRLGHRTNLFWAAHGLHHTGEEMNLAIALRTSITQRLFSFLFYWPLLFLGFSPEMIYTATGIHLFLGYWHHTRLINKLHPAFEYFFNSPSHHRVHHGINPKYIDKNYAEILIIWDRLFGTFEAEAEDPVYGSLSPPRTWNPIKLNLQHWNYMRRAIRATSSVKEKILLPVHATGMVA
jgi:alkylglycerol monooxygenase